MNHIYPDYYESFRCIASLCRHNCCIGWEIDIDEDTLSLYDSIKGDFGKRLRENISPGETSHFILGKNQRCPFLDDNNLCQIISRFGEGHLCKICREHPRFHNELPDRVESGLGLSCEEAAKLILTKKEKTVLLGNQDTDDEIILLRDKIIEIFQQRDLYIDKRIEEVLALIDSEEFPFEKEDAKEFFLSLERLDEKWEETLELLSIPSPEEKRKDFLSLFKENETVYEQFFVYLIYRHTACAPDLFEAKLRVLFALYSLRLFIALTEGIFILRGELLHHDFIEVAREFSSEIEYSDENLYEILEKIENHSEEEFL